MQARVSKRGRESAIACCRGLFSAGRQTVRGSLLALYFLDFATELNSVLTSIRFKSSRGSVHFMLGRFIGAVVSSEEVAVTSN
jgi:hypothetical protein